VRWESDGNGEFSVEQVSLPMRGTRVVLHLKSDAHEFADAWKIRSLVKRYSDHIGFPVRLPKSAEKGSPGDERESINSAQALWTRARSEIKDEEYNEFYQTVARDFTPPLGWTHNRVEGKREYTTLLYVPSHAPFDLWNRDGSRGLKLYVKRVFILDDAEQFLPLYLRFVKGIVDSSDLPLNVSRELLQTDSEIEAMRAGIARRVLDLLAKLSKDEPEKFATFWKEFGQVLKEGIAEDAANRDRIAKLLRFASTHTDIEKQDQSLDDYLARAKSGQKHIYYLTADTWNAARQSPHLERLRRHGIEVLLMHDRVDEWMLSYMGEYEGKAFQDVAAADLDLGDLVPSESEADSPKADALCARLTDVLSERVDAVKPTQRLAESPACLVRASGEMSAQMRRLMEAAGQSMPAQKPTLEVNPGHPLIARLEATTDDGEFRDLALLLADQATLAEGGQLAEPGEFVRRLNRLLLGSASTP
jgi:molecular chaperone HtpG